MASRKQSIGGSPYLASIKSLVTVFAAWKLLLLCLSFASPGPGYDTSTQLLLPSTSSDSHLSDRLLSHLVSKLVRWDAFYFVSVAQRGYLFEQEWAFGWGFTKSVSFLAKALPVPNPVLREALAGILIAHAFHLLTVLTLFALTLQVLPAQHQGRVKVAFVAATLHILSPAGLFLSAPYAETLFSFLNFLGMLLYSHSFSQRNDGQLRILDLVALLGSGFCWGLASTIRGNGILSGIILLYRSVMLLKSLPKIAALQELTVTVLAGVLVALGAVFPQWIAYQDYCLNGAIHHSRTWCSQLPPSIYTYVQEHYWNNGFLRYWTLSNAPLFMLAIPVLCLLLVTAFIAISNPEVLLQTSQKPRGLQADSTVEHRSDRPDDTHLFVHCMRAFSVLQALLALLALTNFHIQIINRISSGYPIWYMVLAILFVSRGHQSTNDLPPSSLHSTSLRLVSQIRKRTVQQWTFTSMLLYALVQGGLYASFMPPA